MLLRNIYWGMLARASGRAHRTPREKEAKNRYWRMALRPLTGSKPASDEDWALRQSMGHAAGFSFWVVMVTWIH